MLLEYLQTKTKDIEDLKYDTYKSIAKYNVMMIFISKKHHTIVFEIGHLIDLQHMILITFVDF